MPHLSPKSLTILQLLADGHSLEQILALHLDFTYLDISQAATEALGRPNRTASEKRYPRTYETWSPDEDDSLRKHIASQMTVAQIARQLQRRRKAIRTRIANLNLIPQLSSKEQSRLRRIMGLPSEPD